MDWNDVVEKVTPYIVKIETPNGYGTGFAFFYNASKGMCGIATAAHVVQDTETWQQPIRVIHHHTSQTVFLPEADRIIFTDARTDSAVILVPNEQFEFPEKLIPLRPIDNALRLASRLAGWVSPLLCLIPSASFPATSVLGKKDEAPT
jgi:hypothetical protein